MSVNFSHLQMDQIVVHRVGNKHRAERNFISSTFFEPDEMLSESLQNFFLKPLKRPESVYHFQHESDLAQNELYSYAQTIFENPENLLSESVNILQHLYRQSDHPNIKSGELFVVYFQEILYEDELVEGLGIFKSEQKHGFFQVAESGDQLLLNQQEGIQIDKLDKACLILNTSQADGFRVLSADNNQYDASYWLFKFLNVDFVRNETYHTRAYLEMCNDFSKEVIIPTQDKKEQMKFLSDSVDYFANHEEFNFQQFTEEVMPNEEMVNEFRNFTQDYGTEESATFTISKPAIQQAKRKFGNTIKLDTNIQIRLDFNKPESSRRFIEKGYDEERNMHYYKVYFNEEME
ncbi:MAG: nucleoid-associated protein [Bacteroidota bacterium]